MLKFPAFVSLLAAASDKKLDEAERKSALQFSHNKTYSSDALLAEFYTEEKFLKVTLEPDKDLPAAR